MQTRSTRSTRSTRALVAVAATFALTASALVPSAVLGRGPGPGAGACDGECLAGQAQAAQRQRARDGSADQVQARGRASRRSAKQTATRAAAGGGGQVRARAAGGPGPGAAAKLGVGAGRGWDEDALRGPEYCDACDAEMGTLTETDIEGLVYMVNEEKLAHDVYREFAQLYDLWTFERIADSEARHLLAVRTVLERYGIDDPTSDLEAGAFSLPELQQLYDELVAQGSADLDSAIAAAVTIESADIADLEQTMAGLEETAPDVFGMYSHLLAASSQHLDAFQRQQ